jgi:hypothetical protein
MTNAGVRLIATHVHHWDPGNAVQYPYPRNGPGAVGTCVRDRHATGDDQRPRLTWT